MSSRALSPVLNSRLTLAAISVVLAVASVVASISSLAVFTDSASVDGNAFTTSTIDISTSPTTALVTYSGMLPGDSTTGALTVSNAGGGELRYALTSSSTNTDTKGLKDQLTATIRTVDVDGVGCGSFDGTQLYSGALGSAAFGSATAGAQTGDRTLAASASETLCFQVALPSSTGNEFQNATTTTTFTFQAEQTANNS